MSFCRVTGLFICPCGMDHETQFACDQQAATLDDAHNFVKYMASADLFASLDLSSMAPLEGRGNQANMRMHTTRLITDHMNTMISRVTGAEEEEDGKSEPCRDVSTLYRTGNKMKQQITTFGEQYRLHHAYNATQKAELMRLLAPSEPITEKDLKREIITIRSESSPHRMRILIENYVYVTYLCDKNKPFKRCRINLLDMAAKTLMFGTQYSQNKFSKIDFRTKHGSHLVFDSGVLVETGSTSPLLSAKLLEHRMKVFRHVCGYHNIGIRERRCHNVVATASLSFGVCLELLKHRYPFITYKKSVFAGAIARMNDIDVSITARTNGTTIFDDIAEYTNYEKGRVKPEDEYNRKYNNIGSETEQREQEIAAEVIRQESGEIATYELAHDESDMLCVLRADKEKNIKNLIFQRSVICVGSKSREDVIASFTTLYPILESCRDTPENIKIEKRLINAQRAKLSNKKRKATMMTTTTTDESNESHPAKRTKLETTTNNTQVTCRLCEFSEPMSNYGLVGNSTKSANAVMCNSCAHCICNECINRLDIASVIDPSLQFLCPLCIIEQ